MSFSCISDQEISMVETRDTASSVMINPSVLWVTGGKHFVEGSPLAVNLASTEYLSLADGSPSGPGPNLPIHVWGHCLFAMDESGIILTGGVSNEHYSSARTYMFDLASSSWTEVNNISDGSFRIFNSLWQATVFSRTFLLLRLFLFVAKK